MWEVWEFGNEDLLWSCIAFNGGIAGQQQAPCGAVSASTVCIGLRNRCSPSEREKAKQARSNARQDASELVRSFIEKFGAISCRDLVGLDFSKPGVYQQFQESGMSKEKCDNYVRFVVEKMYEQDEKRDAAKAPQREKG